MTTTRYVSESPTPKSAVRPTPQRPAQAAPIRRESPAGLEEPRVGGGIIEGIMGGITPGGINPYNFTMPFAGGDDV